MLPSFLLLANTTPPAGIGSWVEIATYLVLTAGGVVALLVGIKSLRERALPTPQPFVVRGEASYATSAELAKLAAHLDKHITETDARFREAAATSSASREKIYALIRSEVGSVHARLHETNGLLRELKGKLDATLELKKGPHA